ncbi:MAG: GMC family oxidoreductase [Deltaproteobacteria bacterium]|nr:MAG: GMC family oxidoreductase [Deltaproteobacteria bacterium]
MDYDVIIIGSGFGGSVPALRLSEKGYRVAVLEQGRRVSPPIKASASSFGSLSSAFAGSSCSSSSDTSASWAAWG